MDMLRLNMLAVAVAAVVSAQAATPSSQCPTTAPNCTAALPDNLKFAPRLAELPVGATSAAQAVTVAKPTLLTNALNNSGVGNMKDAVSADAKGKTYAEALVNAMKASGQLPATLPGSAPTIYTFAALDLKGTMSQENPTNPPPSCPYGYASGPTWSGWTATGWQYSCNSPPPPPPPPPSGGGGGGGPVLCQGSYCLQPDGSVTNGGSVVSGLVGQVTSSGEIVILQYDNPYQAGTPQVVETVSGVNAVLKPGYGIVAQSGATSVSGSGASVAGNQIAVNQTNLSTGQQSIALGGGYTYYASPNDPHSGQLCGPSGCVSATSGEGQIRAVIGDSIVNAQIGAKSDQNRGVEATSSIIKTTVTNIFTGQTTDVTGATAVPVTGN